MLRTHIKGAEGGFSVKSFDLFGEPDERSLLVVVTSKSFCDGEIAVGLLNVREPKVRLREEIVGAKVCSSTGRVDGPCKVPHRIKVQLLT